MSRYGRHPVLVVSVFAVLVTTIANSFSINYICYAVLRFLIGFFDTCRYMCAFVIGEYLCVHQMPIRQFKSGVTQIYIIKYS